MKCFIFASFLFVAVSSTLVEETLFQSFKVQHGKTYRNQAEELKRFAIFSDNLRTIEEHNAQYDQGLKSYKMGVNQFADMTPAEFAEMLKLQAASKPKLNITGEFKLQPGFKVPESVDWRSEGYVTPVKNQGQCGGCWAFSLVASTEGAYYRKNKKLVSLSEQQLIDCATDVNYGCDGGFLEQTWPYIQENGFETEETYPFTQVNGDCKYDSSKVVTKISSFVVVSGNENKLLEAVGSVGPVSVAIDATWIQFYSSGIFSNNLCSKTELNHGVTAVGYGSENGQDYWIVKNSWGTAYGERGYIRMERGVNQCGIAHDTTYPVIN